MAEKGEKGDGVGALEGGSQAQQGLVDTASQRSPVVDEGHGIEPSVANDVQHFLVGWGHLGKGREVIEGGKGGRALLVADEDVQQLQQLRRGLGRAEAGEGGRVSETDVWARSR